MTTTPKGYTLLDNNSPMAGPDQINTAERFVEDLIGEHVANAGALPATGNWPQRIITTDDTGAVYIWFSNGWKFLTQPAAAWVSLTIASGWTPNQSAPPYAPLRARLNQIGNVELQGQILPKAGYAATDVFATLPAGMRPSARLEVPVMGNNAATRVLGGVIIDTNGNLSLNPVDLGAFNFGTTQFPTV